MRGCIERLAPWLDSCHAFQCQQPIDPPSFLGCTPIEADSTTQTKIADLSTISRNYHHATCMGLQEGCLTLSTPDAADWLSACSAWLTRQSSSRTSDSKTAWLRWQHWTTLQPLNTAFWLFLGAKPALHTHTHTHTHPTNPPHARSFANLSCLLPFSVLQFLKSFLFYWFNPAVTCIYLQYPPIYRFYIGYLQNSPTSHCRVWYTVRTAAPTYFQILKLLLHPKDHLYSSVSLQPANSFMKFRLQIEIPGPHIMRYYPLFFAARQSVFLFYRTYCVSIFFFCHFLSYHPWIQEIRDASRLLSECKMCPMHWT